MAIDTVTCPQCKTEIPRERLTCKSCGFEIFKHGLTGNSQSQGSGNGTALGCTVLTLAVVLAAPIYLMNRCSAHFAPTETEIAEQQKKYDEEDRVRQAFEREQASFWKQPVSDMTSERMIEEISKCKNRTSPPGSAAVYFSDYNVDAAVKAIKAGSTTVELVGQRRMEIGGKIAVTTFKCRFKGVGFEDLDAHIDGYIDSFIPGW